jgi:restriction system protein
VKLEDILELSPSDFERLMASMLITLGYNVKPIDLGEDIAIDILANNDQELIGIQVKKYKSRKVNLLMIYHTFGAAAYYDCNKAVIITLSELASRAMEAAKKLKVEIWGRDSIL